MVNAFSGCTTNHTKNGCPFNANTCAGGCPTSTCCKQKTACQQTIQDNLDKVAAYRLQLRLLSDDFKKRPTSKCDTVLVPVSKGSKTLKRVPFVPLSKAEYQKKKAKLEKKINKCLEANKKLKNTKKGKLLVRDPHPGCAGNGGNGGNGGCPCAHVPNYSCKDYNGVC